MTDPDLILATDLDGTFLGGTTAARRSFYDWIEDNRRRVTLVFVTGRDLPFISQLIEDGVPRPDMVIGDVGTTIVHGHDFSPVSAVQDWVAGLWQDAGDRVRAMLADEPGLTLQPTPFERRVSYYYEPETLKPDTVAKIEAAGFDCITSADTYLDVLPPGVAKGPTLLRLTAAMGWPQERVLVAGDTMNDLSLFETGLKGVAVGNSEPRLVAELPRFANTYHANGQGCAGIREAIAHHRLIAAEAA